MANLLKKKYDKLVISTGAKPIQPNIDGINTIPHFVLRNIPHLDEIMKFIKEHSPKKCLNYWRRFYRA